MRCMVQEDGVANERKQEQAREGEGERSKDEERTRRKKRERNDKVEGEVHVAARLVLGLI